MLELMLPVRTEFNNLNCSLKSKNLAINWQGFCFLFGLPYLVDQGKITI